MTRSEARTLAVLALFGACGCGSGPVSSPTRHIVEAELGRAAAAGYPANIVVEESGVSQAKPRTAETLVVIGPHAVRVLPAPVFEEFVASGFERYLLQVWVAPYIAASDYDGAVRAAARGYVRALEDQNIIAKGPPLPPVPDPNEWGFRFPSRNTDWGLPLSLTVFSLALALDRLARKKETRGTTS